MFKILSPYYRYVFGSTADRLAQVFAPDDLGLPIVDLEDGLVYTVIIAGTAGSSSMSLNPGTPLATVTQMDFYFDAAGGSPNHTGLSRAQAFKDLPDLLASNRLPARIEHSVVLHFKASGVQGVPAVYTFPVFFQLFLDANFVFEADEAWDPTCFETVGTFTTEAGTTASVLNVTGLTADLYNGDWVEFTSGPAFGSTPPKRCMIRDNTTGAFNLVHQIIGGVGVGSTFKVKRSTGVRFMMPSDVIANIVMRVVSAATVTTLSEGFAPVTPAVFFVGIELYMSGSLFPDIVFSGGIFQLYGCRKSGDAGNGWALSFVDCCFGIGCAPGIPDALDTALNLAPFGFNDGRWVGWGLQQTDDDTWAVVQIGSRAFGTAFVYAKTSEVIGTTSVDGALPGTIVLMGRISDGSYGTAPITSGGSIVRLGDLGSAQTIIAATGGTHAIQLFGQGKLVALNALIQTVNGHQLFIYGKSFAEMTNTVTGTPSGTGKSVAASEGSRVLLIGPPVLGAAFSVNDGADVLAAAFASEGTAKINQYDGTCIVTSSSGITALSTDGSLSGTYTPTLTNVANLDGSAAFVCRYSRVGKIVMVSGKVTVDPTSSATSTKLGISLPIASNLASDADLAGAAFASGIAGQGAAILGDATNDRAQLQFISSDVTSQAMYFTFQYTIL